jgi:hypothetical protein
MSPHDANGRVLEALAREAAEGAAEPNFERIEARLFKELSAERAVPRAKRWPMLALAAVVIGSAVFAVTALEREEPAAREQHIEPASLAHAALRVDGTALAPSESVSAGERDVIVEHSGSASWTLEPGSRASVVREGGALIVRLETGALTARVMRRDGGEVFAVEAAHTRVTVHGTAFRVAHQGEAVLVSVSEGTVIVGPAGRAPDPASERLAAPGRRSFAAAAWTSPEPEPTAAAAAVVAGPAARKRAAGSALGRGPRAGSALPESPAELALPERTEVVHESLSLSQTERGLSEFFGITQACFAEGSGKTASVGLSIRAMATLDVAPDGTVRSVAFSPPLAPTLDECITEHIAAMRFAVSQRGATIVRAVELSRP